MSARIRSPARRGRGAERRLPGPPLSRDLDLVCRSEPEVRDLVRRFPTIAAELEVPIRVVRDAGTFVRAEASSVTIDVLFDPTPDLAPVEHFSDVGIQSLADLRARKLTCLLSRSEPRDLVDVMFLDRAGFAPESDLPLATQKDSGMDPGVLAWLLGQFPIRPLPRMLKPLTEDELLAFRDKLQERFRVVALP